MLLGIQLRTGTPGVHGNDFDTVLAVARACEQAGLDAVFGFDHVMYDDMPILEAFVTLGAIAASTTRIRIGQLVTGVPFRNPALLAKMCTTLDVVSHGRSIIGLGAGWHEPEFRGYGWPFPPVRERMEMLEEAVQIVDLMLTQRVASFQGKHYGIDQAVNVPGPVQQPRPPIMIGGSGERVTLKLVAKYADMCNLQSDDAAAAKRDFDILRAHCDAVGRPFDAITRSKYRSIMIARDDAELAAKRARFPDFVGISGTPGEVIAGLQEFADVGCQYITFDMPDAEDIEPLLLLGETVVPEVAGL